MASSFFVLNCLKRKIPGNLVAHLEFPQTPLFPPRLGLGACACARSFVIREKVREEQRNVAAKLTWLSVSSRHSPTEASRRSSAFPRKNLGSEFEVGN